MRYLPPIYGTPIIYVLEFEISADTISPNVLEVVFPFLFFVPIRSVRITEFCFQLLLKSEFNDIVSQILTYSVHFGLLSLAGTVLYALSNVIFDNQGSGNKVLNVASTVFYTIIAALLFLLQHLSLNSTSNSTVNPSVRTVYNRLHKLHAVNQYGLFSKMAGVDGRLEIILEASDNAEGPWREYNFLYKPGNVNHSLPFVAPYAPKLDWQMYWAAYSTYEKNPWLLSLAHRLLIGKPEVFCTFRQVAFTICPEATKIYQSFFVQIQIYVISKATWWTRERVAEYFPPYSKDNSALLDYLKARNLLPTLSNQFVNPIWKQILDGIRYITNHLEATLLFWSVLTAGLALICTSSGSSKK
ncbi:hypothetical protein NQ317_012406 [Molorchus minor]|uniref:Lipase maturation factor 2 n=1 Tax=Molorchus minor TaxID=1323400 RepID=A0ABQ9JIC5_9CUCU|nr:hypothetical protein NQ317_012406 [Molorchus minor]